jgi:hypothetical protein
MRKRQRNGLILKSPTSLPVQAFLQDWFGPSPKGGLAANGCLRHREEERLRLKELLGGAAAIVFGSYAFVDIRADYDWVSTYSAKARAASWTQVANRSNATELVQPRTWVWRPATWWFVDTTHTVPAPQAPMSVNPPSWFTSSPQAPTQPLYPVYDRDATATRLPAPPPQKPSAPPLTPNRDMSAETLAAGTSAHLWMVLFALAFLLAIVGTFLSDLSFATGWRKFTERFNP